MLSAAIAYYATVQLVKILVEHGCELHIHVGNAGLTLKPSKK